MCGNLITLARPSLFVGLLLIADAPCLAAEAVNEFCPVLVDRKATPRHSLVYQGKEIQFCCSECVKEFEEHPQVYAGQVPQLQQLAWHEKTRALLDANTRFALIGLLVGTLGASRFVGWKWPAKSDARPGPLRQLFSRRIPVVVPLAIVCALLGGLAWKFERELFYHQMADQIHYATFYDFGYPPVPVKPRIENRIQTTYYRGNDERSSALGSGGNYRTASFHLSLATADCRMLNYGDQVAGDELFVRFEIERAPYTPDFMYSEKLMSHMFLTQQCDRFLGRSGPAPDAVNLTMTEPMQQWEASFPIGKISEANCCPEDRLRGIIYVCERYYYQAHWWSQAKDTRGGSRYHYAIQYDLHLEDGALAADSNLWMGYLYRTRKFPAWKVPFDEWFSWDPEKIPVLTEPNATDDPEALGISDYDSDA